MATRQCPPSRRVTAAFAFQCLHAGFQSFDRIVRHHWAFFLQENFPRVHSFVDHMDRHAGLFVAGSQHRFMRVGAGEFQQQCGMQEVPSLGVMLLVAAPARRRRGLSAADALEAKTQSTQRKVN